MGIFHKSAKKDIALDNPVCCTCGKKIRRTADLNVIDGKMYCPKCAARKKDWDLITFAAIVDD